MLAARRRTHTTAVALSFLTCVIASTCVVAAETPALKILRNIQSVQGQHGFLARELLPPLVELGQLYGSGQCDRAIDILDLALEVSRRNDGLFNPQQLEIYQHLLNCYLTLDRPADLDRAQQYALMIDEQRYGQNDMRMLPTLEEAARRYEQGGLYLSARKLHRRAVDIARRNAGDDDLALIGPLRGIARAFRLEYVYGLAMPDVEDIPYSAAEIVSYATFNGTDTRLDPLGERSLDRAVDILRNHPDADPEVFHDTLLELGDWHQLASQHRTALRVYRELWRVLNTAEPTADASRNLELLSNPSALVARHRTGVRLRRPPADVERYQQYTVDLKYTVTREGRVKDIAVIESNAPRDIEIKVARDLKQTRYRPRFLDGEPVDTADLHHRQNSYSPRRMKANANTQVAAK